jgi:hypothetical protein
MKKLIVGIVMVTATSLVFAQTPIVTDSTSRSTSESKNETTVNSPPPTAVAPSINTMNNDLCTVGVSGAVQTQVLGISGGSTVRDLNCERIKLAKNLYDMGMKVAAISTLCQDERVFTAMMNAGTPCPVDGKIGAEAKQIWEENPNRQPSVELKENRRNDTLKGYGMGISTALLLLLLL